MCWIISPYLSIKAPNTVCNVLLAPKAMTCPGGFLLFANVSNSHWILRSFRCLNVPDFKKTSTKSEEVCVQSSNSQWGASLPSRGHLATSQDTFSCHTSGRGLAMGTLCGWGPGTLLHILKCTARCPQQRLISPHVAVVLRLRNCAF